MTPVPALPLGRLGCVPRLGARFGPGEPGVAVGVAAPDAVSTGEGKGVGCAGVLNGVEETLGEAVCAGVELAVGTGVRTEAAGAGSVVPGVGVCVLSAEDVAAGGASWASAMPPSTAAYRPAEQRARARIFLKVTRLLHARGAAAGDGGDSAQLRHRAPRA